MKSELVKCKKAVHGMELAVLLFLISVIIFSTVAYSKTMTDQTEAPMSPEDNQKVVAASVLLFLAL